jgi:hypothetical protein
MNRLNPARCQVKVDQIQVSHHEAEEADTLPSDEWNWPGAKAKQ